MSDAQQVVDECLPMLDDVLGKLGLHQEGAPLNFGNLLDPFSDWLIGAEIDAPDRGFAIGVVGAFICEYLIATARAIRTIEDGRILLSIPVESGVFRQFDPYRVAAGIVENRSSLSDAVRAIVV